LAVLQRLWTLTCRTTGRPFTTDTAVVIRFGDTITVQARCTICNALNQCAGDLGDDPEVPAQVHGAIFHDP